MRRNQSTFVAGLCASVRSIQHSARISKFVQRNAIGLLRAPVVVHSMHVGSSQNWLGIVYAELYISEALYTHISFNESE